MKRVPAVLGFLIFVAPFTWCAPVRASALTDPTQLVNVGDSWPEYTVRQLSDDAFYGGAIGTLSPTYTAARGEGPAAGDLASGAADLAALSGPLRPADLQAATSNGIAPAYLAYGESAVSMIVAISLNNRPTPVDHLNLKLSTVAKIYTSVIRHWFDPEVVQENPDLAAELSGHLASTDPIHRVDRGDSSQTTAALIAAFLADPEARPIWNAYAAGLGAPTDTPLLKWPSDGDINLITTTAGEKGVVTAVENLDPNGNPADPHFAFNTIGYVSPQYAVHYKAVQVGLSAARGGTYAQPTNDAVTAAFASPGTVFDPSTGLFAIDYSKLSNPGAYPIPIPAYFGFPIKGGDPAKAAATAGFLRFVLGDKGQADIASTGMVNVAPDVRTADLAILDRFAPVSTPTINATGGPAGGIMGAIAAPPASGASAAASSPVGARPATAVHAGTSVSPTAVRSLPPARTSTPISTADPAGVALANTGLRHPAVSLLAGVAMTVLGQLWRRRVLRGRNAS